jgi:hypothetical protein
VPEAFFGAAPSPTGTRARRADVLRAHADLVVVRERLRAAGLVGAHDFAEYDALGVSPRDVGRGSSAHWDAVRALALGLARASGRAPRGAQARAGAFRRL